MVEEFAIIQLENMPPVYDKIKFSTDAQYLFEIAIAISEGAVSSILANKKPGPIVNSCWLTKACRILRLYVATPAPSYSLKTLAEYLMRVYVPMYFNVKYYSSVIYGSTNLFKFIRWTRYLPPGALEVVNERIENNSYFAHPENILLAMLFDGRKEVLNRAIKKILRYRAELQDLSAKVREYKKPPINFNCTDYTNMVDLNNDENLLEPAFTRDIPYEHLEEFLNYDEPPLIDPEIPSHIQATEQHVQLLTAVSKRAIE